MRGIVASLCGSLVAACQTVLPPPAVPAAVMPPLAPAATAPFESRVAIDADEPSRVDVRTSTSEYHVTTVDYSCHAVESSPLDVRTSTSEYRDPTTPPIVCDGEIESDGGSVTGVTYQTLCMTTPCATSLPSGAYRLRIRSNRDPSHAAISRILVPHSPIDIRVALGHNRPPPRREHGLAVIAAGALLMFVGGLIVSSQTGAESRAGYAVAGGGAIGFGTGLWMLLSNSYGGTVQPGAAVEWAP